MIVVIFFITEMSTAADDQALPRRDGLKKKARAPLP
jgi:hypothetical protein